MPTAWRAMASNCGIFSLHHHAQYELAPVELAAAATALSPSFAAASSSGAGQAPASTDATPRRHTAADFYRAYASGATTPAEVAERIIAAVAASETQVGLLCWRMLGKRRGRAASLRMSRAGGHRLL